MTKNFYEIFIQALASLYGSRSIFYLSEEKRVSKREAPKEMKKMTARAIADVRGTVLASSKDDLLIRLKRSWTAAFATSAALGVLAGISGLGINGLFLFDIAENKGTLSLAGTWLLVVAFPLLFLSAHCLDRVDIVERMIRAEYCDKHGVKDSDC